MWSHLLEFERRSETDIEGVGLVRLKACRENALDEIDMG